MGNKSMVDQAAQRSGNTFRTVCKWLYRLRSVFLAIPVAAASVILALHNLAKLPSEVAVNMQASGETVQLISKAVAVFGPLALTAFCLLLMFCSRKVLYPWLISVFSLALPVILLITNVFPA